MSQDIELWIRELQEAGWVKWGDRWDTWMSPEGELHRGPYGAWCKMLRSKSVFLGYYCPDCKRQIPIGDSVCTVTKIQHLTPEEFQKVRAQAIALDEMVKSSEDAGLYE